MIARLRECAGSWRRSQRPPLLVADSKYHHTRAVGDPGPKLLSDNRLQTTDSDNQLWGNDMRSDDGSADPAPAPQPAVRSDENGHVEGEVVGEPAMVDALQLSTELGPRLTAMATTLAELAARYASASDRALARERVIDRQHEEIERLRSVERAGQLRPVITDLCQLRNGLLRQAGTVPDEMTGSQVASLLNSFAATAAEALERCGITVLPREVGVPFTPSRQQVAAVVEIDDPERDGTVAEVVQDGYAEIDSGKVVIPARVRLYRCVMEEKADG